MTHAKNQTKELARCNLFAGNDLEKYTFFLFYFLFGTGFALYIGRQERKTKQNYFGNFKFFTGTFPALRG
jgi:hypothetical protein